MHDYVLTLLRLLCTEESQDEEVLEEEEEQEEGSVACANAIAKATANNEWDLLWKLFFSHGIKNKKRR